MEQQYELYTSEDREVWKQLYTRQHPQIVQYASQAVIDGMELCGFKADEIPDFRKVNENLSHITGWEIYAVPGLIDNKLFFENLALKKFPCATWLRTMEQLDYLEEPDMFHDVFGHVPLLTNHEFTGFLSNLAVIALKNIDDEDFIERMSRLYWYTVEFGLIKQNGVLKAYGAGILSSIGETKYSLFSDQPKRVPYDLHTILDTPYIKDKYQEQYYVINSYEELFASIENYNESLMLNA
jgi:phenylalanine-4-hydroxylase